MHDTQTTTNGQHNPAGRPKRLSPDEARAADDQATANLVAATKAEEKSARIRAAARQAYEDATAAHAADTLALEAAETAKQRTRRQLRTAEGEVK